MMFEEKKQKIIKALKCEAIRNLQPDKPRCSTCKYLRKLDSSQWCGMGKSKITIEFDADFKSQDFSCGFHIEDTCE